MASPITWQNINGPDPKAAMLPMAVASQTLNNAFSGLKDTLTDYQTDTKDRNTNAFMDALASRYRTPEEYQAAMASGEIDQLRASFGSMINAEQARKAPGELLTQALSRAEAFDKRADYTTERDNRSQVNALYGRAAGGDENAIAEISALGLPDVGKHITALQTSLNSHSIRNNARDANDRANTAHEQSTALNTLNLNDLSRKAEEGTNLRGANDFLARSLQEHHQAVRPNAEGLSMLTPEEQSKSIENLIAETADRFKLDMATARDLVMQHDQAAGAAGRSGYGEMALTAQAMQTLEDAMVDQEYETHPFRHDPTNPAEKLTTLNKHIADVAKTKESWKIFGTSEHEKISREAAHYASKPWTYTIRSGPEAGKKVQREVPLAAHQYAAQQTFDSWANGDVDVRDREATSYHRYLSEFMERPETLTAFEKLEQLENKRLARKARVGGAAAASGQ